MGNNYLDMVKSRFNFEGNPKPCEPVAVQRRSRFIGALKIEDYSHEKHES
jgi:hypothetical protein